MLDSVVVFNQDLIFVKKDLQLLRVAAIYWLYLVMAP